jgi:hypothetical protein
MLELAKASNHDVTKVMFNGQPVHVGTSVTTDAAETVLRRYEEYCRENHGQSGDDFTEIEKALAKSGASTKADPPEIVKSGFVRAGDKEAGSVVCFVKGPKTKTTMTEAFESFMSTGELGAFGELRFAYASKAPSGSTLVLTVWTDSAFKLRNMISSDGQDSPGEDFPEVPRLPRSTRVMSANAAGKPYGVNVYRTADAPSRALEFFDREMKAGGWLTYDPEMTEEKHKGLGRAYMKNAVVVTVGTRAESDGTYVAVGLSGVAAGDELGRR